MAHREAGSRQVGWPRAALDRAAKILGSMFGFTPPLATVAVGEIDFRPSTMLAATRGSSQPSPNPKGVPHVYPELSAQDGLDAFVALYERASPSVFRVVVAVTRSRDDAEEVTAEAFARAWKHWDQLDKFGNLEVWVVRTALRLHVSLWRRVRRREVFNLPERPAPPTPPEIDPKLRSAIKRLPRRQREVIALRYLMDLRPNEIAEVLGIAEKTVSVHHHRAIQTLHAMLEGEEVQ